MGSLRVKGETLSIMGKSGKSGCVKGCMWAWLPVSVLTLERVQARLGGVCLLRYSGAMLMSPDVFVE